MTDIAMFSQSDIKHLDGNAESVEDVAKMSNGLTTHEETVLTPEERMAEKKFIRKVDLTILPLITIMYFLASLDRGDTGNAAIAGMSKQLKITPADLSTCVSVFYVGYVVFLLPGDLFLRAVNPGLQMGLALICWGFFTAILSLAKTWQAIAGIRVCIGSCEAFLQAALLYIVFWYKRDQLATRGSIVFAMSAVSGSLNGLIAYGITIDLNGAHGLPAWKWIFIIEGVVTVGFGFIVIFLLPPVPEKLNRGWTSDEKAIAIRRSREAFNSSDAKIQLKQIVALLKDPKAWFLTSLYCCVDVSFGCFSSFLPVIVKSFGFAALETQLLVVPVYVATALSTFFVCIMSDRYRRRGIPLMICFSICAAGWLILLVSKSRNLSYAGTYFIGIGAYPCVVLVQSWMNNNFIGFTKRAGGLALINTFGQCFVIMGTEVYSDAPYYHRGNGFAFAFSVAGAIIAGVFILYLRWKNLQKKQNQGTAEAATMRASGIEEIMDDHPDFFYYL